MKVQALEQFNDMIEKVMRRKGDIFNVTEKRFEEINSTSFGILIEAIKEESQNINTVAENKQVKSKEKQTKKLS
jgi:hypothetical protein